MYTHSWQWSYLDDDDDGDEDDDDDDGGVGGVGGVGAENDDDIHKVDDNG